MSSAARALTRPFLVCSLALVACSSDTSMASAKSAVERPGEAPPQDETDTLYDPKHLVDVQITMNPAEWERIRSEGRSLSTVYTGCDKGYDYTWVTATVTIDGVTKENVAVRKKGFLGSLSQVKPALKLDFNRNVKGQTIWGVKGLTLNNDRQDVSHTRQCMAYQLFNAANSPAPRCNFAKVTVNGQELGIYSNVENIKEGFLVRHFDDEDGNLYEGSGGGDFHPAMLARFEAETNEKENDRADLNRVVEALEASDADLYRALSEVVDMDAFLTFWAMESITGHWDGYAGNQNNYYVYHHPKNQKFYFIPSGTDDAFHTGHNSFAPGSIPVSAFAGSWLTNRLYAIPETRAMYQQKVRTLLERVWVENDLLAEVDRIGALTSADPRGLSRQREFIRTRKQAILAELSAGAPDWVYKPRSRAAFSSSCLPTFPITGRFDTVWGDLNAFAPSPGSAFRVDDTNKPAIPYELHTTEINQTYARSMASSGIDQGSSTNSVPGTPSIWIIGAQGSMGSNIVVSLMIERSRFGAREVPFYAFESFGAVVRSKAGPGDSQIVGMIGDGKVVFDEVGTTPGSRIRGSFSGVYIPMIADQLK